jgi:DNA polymerase III epsilon subunit-like protein
LPELTNHRLDTIASHFSIPIVSRHRAGSDALATAELFLLLLSKLEAEHGITDLAAARNFQFSEPKQDEKTPLAFPQEPLIPGL